MKNHDCLSDQDLTLVHYGEQPDHQAHERHLQDCPSCQDRLKLLKRDLAAIPNISCQPDPISVSRVAARIEDQTGHRQRGLSGRRNRSRLPGRV